MEMSRQGALEAIIPVLRCPSIHLQRTALAALRHLSLQTLLKRQIVRAAALPAVLACLRSGETQLAEEVARQRKSKKTENERENSNSSNGAQFQRQEIAEEEDHSLEDALLDMKRQLSGLLANLSEDAENQIVVARAGAVDVLNSLTDTIDLAVMQDVARAFSYLCANMENHILVYSKVNEHSIFDSSFE